MESGKINDASRSTSETGGGYMGTFWTIVIIIVLLVVFGVLIINFGDWNWFD